MDDMPTRKQLESFAQGRWGGDWDLGAALRWLRRVSAHALRPLDETAEHPTKSGYYWARKDGDFPEDARVIFVGPFSLDQPDHLVAWECGETGWVDLAAFFLFAGPIPNPLLIDGRTT